MPYVTVPTEVEVYYDLDDIDTEELIMELEDRGQIVIDKQLNEAGGIFIGEMVKDDLYKLYREYIDWKSLGTVQHLESNLNKFFEKYLDNITS